MTFQEAMRVELVGKPWLLGWHVTGVQYGMTNGSDVATRFELQGGWTLVGENKAVVDVQHDPRNVVVFEPKVLRMTTLVEMLAPHGTLYVFGEVEA